MNVLKNHLDLHVNVVYDDGDAVDDVDDDVIDDVVNEAMLV